MTILNYETCFRFFTVTELRSSGRLLALLTVKNVVTLYGTVSITLSRRTPPPKVRLLTLLQI
jgi:hypothetical protein